MPVVLLGCLCFRRKTQKPNKDSGMQFSPCLACFVEVHRSSLVHCMFHSEVPKLDVWLKTHAQKGALVTAACTALVGQLLWWLHC